MAGDQEHIITIEERILELERAGEYDIMPKRAGKVPPFMRNHPNLSGYLEPRFVSFGPIHHGKLIQCEPAEVYKLRLANYFVNDSGKAPVFLYQKVEDEYYDLLMEYFGYEVAGDYGKQELAWMLFVDGCAVLQSIYCVAQGTFEELEIERDQMALWEQDLFLLENQLPYQLLLDLINSSANGNNYRESIKVFINKHSVALNRRYYDQEEPKRQPAHLLGYLWQILVDENNVVNSHRYEDAVRRQSVPWHHNVRELKTAGINVKPSSEGTLDGIDFFSKLFSFRPGSLLIPPVVVDHKTGLKLVNLIAYEMTGPGMSNYDGVTSYVLFLGSILDGTGDVKELIKARVLYNYLDKDDEVFQLFRDIFTNLMPVPNDHEFHVNVKRRIEKYYGNKYRIWMAQLFHDLFSRPWKILTFFASFSAVLFTAIQAFYPIFSTSGHGEDQVGKKFH